MFLGIAVVAAIWLVGATAAVCCAVGASAEKRLDTEAEVCVEQRRIA